MTVQMQANKHFELIDGVIYEMPSPTVLHQWIVQQEAKSDA